MAHYRLLFETEVTATPSLNKLHSSKWQMSNWKKKYLKEFRNYEFAIPQAKKFRLVEIERCGSRMFDKDNFIGGCKPLLDTLKTKGFIVDDSAKWVEVLYKQIKCKRGQEKTIIKLYREG